MYEVTFLLSGFLFNITTTSEVTARVLARVTKHSRAWKVSKNSAPVLLK
jgi:hypothetical protein